MDHELGAGDQRIKPRIADIAGQLHRRGASQLGQPRPLARVQASQDEPVGQAVRPTHLRVGADQRREVLLAAQIAHGEHVGTVRGRASRPLVMTLWRASRPLAMSE